MDKNELESHLTTSFHISGCPIATMKRFVNFCNQNSKMTKVFYDKNNQRQVKEDLCYSIGLAMLLDAVDADAKTQMLFDRITKLEKQVEDLNDKRTKDSN